MFTKIDNEFKEILKKSSLKEYSESEEKVTESEIKKPPGKGLEEVFIEALLESSSPGTTAADEVVKVMEECIESYLDAVKENGADVEEAADDVSSMIKQLISKMENMKFMNYNG